jgi:hypothetical protein
MHQFALVILLVKVKKSYLFGRKKCHVTQGGGGGAGGSDKCHKISPGGSKKCGKSVTYYLNGPNH